MQALAVGIDVRLRHLSQDSRDRTQPLPCLALLMTRDGADRLLPADETALRAGDVLLFCGRSGVASRMAWVAENLNAITYVVTGDERPSGYVWRLFSRRHG